MKVEFNRHVAKQLFLSAALLLMLALTGCGNVPEPPTGLTVTSTSPVTLSWTAVSGATSYNVYRGTASGGLGSKTRIASKVTGTSYVDTTAFSGSTYYYQITAVNADGSSNSSNEVQTVSSYQSGTFSLVGNVVDSQVTLTWSTVSGAASYSVYRGTTSVFSEMLRIQAAVIATTFTDTPAAGNTTYYYQIVALDSSGTEVGRSAIFSGLIP